MRRSSPTTRGFQTALLLSALAAAGSGCALSSAYIRADAGHGVPPAAPDAIDSTLLLIGDAGLPALNGPEPVLQALRAEAELDPERTLVVFLGDNIYPNGSGLLGENDREHAETVLRLQVEAVGESGARGIFIPGNHDHRSDDWKAIQRQGEYIESLGYARVELLPRNGCPGPEVLDLGEHLRLILIDSVWWIDDRPVSDEARPGCATSSDEEVLAAISAALAAAPDRRAVVVAHHPLAAHGQHGGFFTWKDHVFPLTKVKSWLWIPLPVLGSTYVWWRTHGHFGQDLSSSQYRHMIESLDEAFSVRPPLVHAAGHEHNLQVLEGGSNLAYVLVSGAGSVARAEHVSRGDDTLFASPEAGYMRIDALRDGRVRLEVVEVGETGAIRRPWSTWLVPEPRHPTSGAARP
ncbi:MAG: metallophosphoesterase [Candidatus Krumholzibacteriia bacterium]